MFCCVHSSPLLFYIFSFILIFSPPFLYKVLYKFACLLEGTNIKISILLYSSNLKMGAEAVCHFGSKHSWRLDISVIASRLPTIPCSNCVGSGLSHRFIRVETG